jgi:hypothetical protein
VREAVRLTLAARPAPRVGADLVVIVRPAALDAAAGDLRGAVRRQLDTVLS